MPSTLSKLVDMVFKIYFIIILFLPSEETGSISACVIRERLTELPSQMRHKSYQEEEGQLAFQGEGLAWTVAVMNGVNN